MKHLRIFFLTCLALTITSVATAKETKIDMGSAGSASITTHELGKSSGSTVTTTGTMDFKFKVNSSSYLNTVDTNFLEPALTQTIADKNLNTTYTMDDIVIADHQSVPVGQTRGKKTEKDESDDRYVCVLDVTIKIKNPSITLGIDKDVVNFSTVSANTINLALDLGTTKFQGTLSTHVDAQCVANWVPSFQLDDFDTPISAEGFAGKTNIEFEVSGNDLTVSKIADPEYSISKININAEHMTWWDEFLTETGLDLGNFCPDFKLFKNESMEDIEACMINVVYDNVKIDKKMRQSIVDSINGSIPDAVLDSLKAEFTSTSAGLNASGSMGLNAFTLNTAPILDSGWQMNYSLDVNRDSCASALTTTSVTGTLGEMTSMDSLADVFLPYAFPQTLANTAALGGMFCLDMAYTDPSGNTFTGTIKPRGDLSIAKGSYQYEQIFMSDADAEGYVLTSDETTSTSSKTKAVSAGTPSATTATAGIPAIQRNETTPSSGWDISVTTETADGIEIVLPSEYIASASVGGASATMDLNVDLHIAGRMETLSDNQLAFKIKQVWVDNFSGETELGPVTISITDLSNVINNQLSTQFYSTKTIIQDYEACSAPPAGEILLSQYYVRQSITDSDCGSNCEIASGVKLTSLDTKGFTFYSVDWQYDDQSMGIGLSGTEPESVTSTSCTSTDPTPDWTNEWMNQMQEMQSLLNKIQKWTIQQGMINAQQEIDRAQNMNFGDFWRDIIIDETQTHTEDLGLYQTDSFKQMLNTITFQSTAADTSTLNPNAIQLQQFNTKVNRVNQIQMVH